jgi:uncharacterized protein YaiL (DUF2058 family)
MGNSLKDQLLRAGVINKQKAQEVSSHLRKKQRQKNKGAASATDEEKASLQQLQAEKIARDRELNRQKQQQVERRAIAAQINQLIELNRLPRDQGETAYNFADGKKVRSLYVSEAVSRQLGQGWLAIVRYGDDYEIVPARVAEKINERDSAVIIVSNPSQTEEKQTDDPYADYKVPDDLMW